MKKKTNLKPIFYGIAIILGIAAFCMLFTNVYKITTTVGNSSTTEVAKGTVAVFGGEFAGLEKGIVFSFMNMLTYILVLAAVVLSVLKLANVCKAKWVDFVIAGLFVVSGIFFFCTTAFTTLDTNLQKTIDAVGSLTKVTKSLGVGAIVGGILSLLAGGTVIFGHVKK